VPIHRGSGRRFAVDGVPAKWGGFTFGLPTTCGAPRPAVQTRRQVGAELLSRTSLNGSIVRNTATPSMPAPRHIFLDTSVFDEQSYNFSSQAFTSLVEASKASPLTLLIPKPTEDEIRRHISDRATEAIKVLEDAGRRAPFLRKWDQWPLRKDEGGLKYHLRGLARKEYDLFKKQFSVVQLDYSENSLAQIMGWYEQGRAPFGPGRKKNEFPDAIALCSLLSYARTKDIHVGVLSLDHDVRDACAFHNELLFFGSIPALTEALLGEEARVTRLKATLGSDPDMLVEAISNEFTELTFFPAEDPSGEVADVEVGEVDIEELNAVNLGDGEATVAFDAFVKFTAHVVFEDREAAFEYGHRGWHAADRRAGTVSASAPIAGTAKIAMNADWSSIARIIQVSIETEEISVNGVPDADRW